MTLVAAPLPPLSDRELESEIRGFFGPRARDLDVCACTTREGIERLRELNLVELGVYGQDPPESFERMCEIIATVAMDDMAQAFSLWCHRMAMEYLHQADSSSLRDSLLSEVRGLTRIGSTSFASATANFLAGTPLSLTYRKVEGGVRINGNIAWASNLEPPFVSIAAASNEDDPSERLVFAYTESTLGLVLPPYPQVLALQATNSTSPKFEEVFIADEDILARDFMGFVSQVLSTFLLLQSSFCWGLATRALAESAELMTGNRTLFQGDLDQLKQRYDSAHSLLRSFATDADRARLDHQQLLALRLECGTLAVESVRLESTLAGGRGYMLSSGTARRLREAAFLPVQAPTEVQLRWLLSRYV